MVAGLYVVLTLIIFMTLNQNFLMSLNKKIISLIKREKDEDRNCGSCTGGMLSSAITSVSGSSKVFTMGLVILKSSQNKYFKVNQKIIKKYGAVSVQCCLAMVNNLVKLVNQKSVFQ